MRIYLDKTATRRYTKQRDIHSVRQTDTQIEIISSKKHQGLRGRTGKHSNIPRLHISVDIQLPLDYCQVDFHGIHSKKIDSSKSQV